MAMTRRDAFQVNGFKAVYKTADGTPEERFAEALGVTSDDAVDSMLARNPLLIDEYWARKRARKEQDDDDTD